MSKAQPARIPSLIAAATLTLATSCAGAAQGTSPSDTAPISAASLPDAASPNDLLPDLAMLPLEAFHLSYEGQKKVIRFSADVVNIGKGPLEITGFRAKASDPQLKVNQTILLAKGGQRTVATTAVMRYSALDGHDHFHVQDFERYRLRPAGGNTWRGSHKEGFCLRDDANLLGRHASRYRDLDCGEDQQNEALQVREGLSEGWVDVYDWYLPGQYIELDGLSLPGDFCVAADVDPQQHLKEETRRNNSTQSLVRITSSDVSVIHQGC